MKIEELRPAPQKMAKFEFRFIRALPQTAGCYALSTASDEILYVGQARSLQSRLLQHWENGRHKESTAHGRISKVSIIEVADPATLNAFERGWINQCELADGSRPPLNKMSAPV
jgi:excinuclease UvrABC nuclease subunit